MRHTRLGLGMAVLGLLTVTRLASGGDENRSDPRADAPAYVPGNLLVKIVDRPGAQGIERAMARVGATRAKSFAGLGVELWRLADKDGVANAIEALAKDAKDAVEYAEPDYLVHTMDGPVLPNDPLRGDLWGLHNLGQTGGVADADVDAPWAWTLGTGSSSVVVAVIDTGLDMTHEDLAANVWTNPGEIPGNGIDDDHNGFVDDVHGWDFVNGDNDPTDDNGHGTHTSGTIGAVGNNGKGVAGVCWNVRIMPLKFLSAGGSGATSDAISAIQYAAALHVPITSNSWGGGGFSRSLERAIANSASLFVVAAGNSATSTVQYPAGYPEANILSVAATDASDALASFSNFSSTWVDLGAPGVNVLSTYKGNLYRTLSGTSMATPHVSGAAALVLSHGAISTAALKAQLLSTVDPIPSLAGKTVTGGRLNVARAVGATEPSPGYDPVPPAAVTDFAAAVSGETSIALTWTAVGDDGNVGSAYLYDVRWRSDGPIDGSSFASSTQASGEPLPSVAGTPEAFTVTGVGLLPGTTYSIGLRVYDGAGNASDLAIASVTTAGTAWTVETADAARLTGYYNAISSYAGSPSVAYAYGGDSANAIPPALRWAARGVSSWAIETVDAQSVSGLSHAFDAAGRPAISYIAGSPATMRFASKSGATWALETVDARSAQNDRTSLAYDPSGRATLAYRTFSSTSGNGKKKTTVQGGLMFSVRSAAGAWTTEVVDADAGARYVSLAYDALGNPAIAYSDDVNRDNSLETLKLARKSGGTWTIEVVETGTAGFGVLCSLAFDPTTGLPSIATAENGVIRFARFDGTAWSFESVAPGTNGVSHAYASDGTPYVSYDDFTTVPALVRVAKRGASSWSSDAVAPVNDFVTSLLVDAGGVPSVVYRSPTPDLNLRYARKP